VHQEFGVERRESPPQDGRPVPVLPDGPLTEIVRQAEAGYPEEICGMVVGQPGAPETYRIRQVTNIANREPQEDPGGVARDARTAYKMDPLEQLRTLREADEKGWDVVAFYHSHPITRRTSPAWIASARWRPMVHPCGRAPRISWCR